jgi:hypothetical protein
VSETRRGSSGTQTEGADDSTHCNTTSTLGIRARDEHSSVDSEVHQSIDDTDQNEIHRTEVQARKARRVSTRAIRTDEEASRSTKGRSVQPK